MFLLNYISVKGFGEAEYWFALIKVSTVIIFIAVGVLMIVGILKGGEHAGWQNWTIGDAPFAGGFGDDRRGHDRRLRSRVLSSSASRPANRKTRVKTSRARCVRCSGVSCCSISSPF